jgi:ribonuclease P protein component
MLPRIYRLPLAKNTKFEGKRERFDFFDLVIRPNEGKRPRLAALIPSKVIKKAVARNRARRLIFKAFENLLGQIDNIDLLVIVKKDLGQFKSQEVTLFLKENLKHAQVLK